MPVTDIAEINVRKGTAAQWTAANSLLFAGELGLETDTKLVKIGDGVTVWNSLGYMPEQIAAQIHLATSKATPVDDDEIPLADSAASFGIKKLTWANLKAILKTYFDPLYTTAIGCQTSKSSTQAVTASTFTVVTFNAEDWDSSGFHDTVTNNSRITIPTGLGGKYFITAKTGFVSGTVPGATILGLYKNGARAANLNLITLADQGSAFGGITLVLAAGDYIELVVYIATNSTLQSSGADYTPCYLSAVYLGA